MTKIDNSSSKPVSSFVTSTPKKEGVTPKSSALNRAMGAERQPQKKEGLTSPEVKEEVLSQSLPNFPANTPTEQPIGAPQNLQETRLQRPGVVLSRAKNQAKALALNLSLESTSETKTSAPVKSTIPLPPSSALKETNLFQSLISDEKVLFDLPSDVLFNGLSDEFDRAETTVEEMSKYLDFAKSWLGSPSASPENIKKVKISMEKMIEKGLKASESELAKTRAKEKTDELKAKGIWTEVKPRELYFNVSVSANYLKEKWQSLNPPQKSSKTKK